MKLNFNERLGIKIRELRERHGDTQERLAAMLSYSMTREKHLTGGAVSKWECGVSEISVTNFREICRRYHADANELLELPRNRGKLTEEERNEMRKLVNQLLELLEK